MTIYFDETCSGVVAGAGLATRPPDIGTAWTKHPNLNELTVSDVGDGALATSDVPADGAGATRYLADALVATDYRVEVIGKRVTSALGWAWGAEVRCGRTSGNQTGYRAKYYYFDNKVHLYKVGGAGVETELGGTGVAQTWALGETHKISIAVVGQTVTVAWDGVDVITATDATHVDGSPAFWNEVVGGSPATYAIALDRFTVSSIGTATGVPLFFRRQVLGYPG